MSELTKSSAERIFKPGLKPKSNLWFHLGIEDGQLSHNEAVHRGFNPLIYKNLIQWASLSHQEFHQVTRIPLSTIKRRLKNNECFSVQESDVIYRLALLLFLSEELFSDKVRALEWMKEKVYGLGGKRPIDMVSTSVDFDMVKDLIGRVEHGVFS